MTAAIIHLTVGFLVGAASATLFIAWLIGGAR